MMKKLILITSFLLSTLTISAQSKWSFGLEAFPNYTIMNFQVTSGFEEDAAIWRESEIGKLCVSQQFYTSFKINEKSSVSIGLGYHNTGNSTKEMTLVAGNNIDPRRGFVYSDSNDPAIPSRSRLRYNHYNIQLPFLYSFQFSKRLYARGGLNTIFNIANKQTHIFTSQNGERKKNTTDYTNTQFRQLNVSARLELGINLMNKETFRIYAEPAVESGLLGVSKNANINRIPLSMGVVFGIQIF